jgi:putative tricarboxylic transport membrane protein
MGPAEGLLYGFSVALSGTKLLAALTGAVAGTLVGVLPGIGPIAGMAMILPFAFALDTSTSLIMMAGMYYGAFYGGSITSILLNMPGEAASAITAIDGYQLTKKGRAGAALAITAIGSFVAATLSILAVMLFSPLLANVGLLFGPADFFALTLGGLLMLTGMSGGSLADNLLPMALGLALATVGQELVTGEFRYTFDLLSLSSGISIVALAVGLFGIAELFVLVQQGSQNTIVNSVRFRDLVPTRREWARAIPSWLRGTAIGFGFGLVPGPAALLSSLTSYRFEKWVSRYRHEMGKGAIEGVAGPEAANNAAATSVMVPLLALGIPFSAATALMLSAMLVKNVQPGPMLIGVHPEIFWGVVASMYIGNAVLLVLNLPLVAVWVSFLRTPLYVLVPAILIFASIGAYSFSNNSLDVVVLFGVALLGYFFRLLDFNAVPMLVAVILGPLIEKHCRETLFLSQGDVAAFVGSPIAASIWGIVLCIFAGRFLLPFARNLRRQRRYSE